MCQPLTLLYPLQSVLDLVFSQIATRSYREKKVELVLNLVVIIINLLILSDYNLAVFSFSERDPIDSYSLVHDAKFSDATSVYFATLNSTVWIRVLYLLRLNRTLGPLIKIILHMSREIFKFLFLLVLILVIFACIGKIEFSIAEFTTFTDSIVTLYSWMLGLFTFAEMEPEGPKGMLYLAFYLLVNMVLLLNFLIAILSSTYSLLVTHGVGLYLESIIATLPLSTFHPRYNILTF